MTWTIDRATEDSAWTDDYVRTVIASPLPPFPPKEQKIGASTVRWWDGSPGHAVIMAEGGSIDDRTLAEQILKAQLGFFGYKRMAFIVDATEELRKTADWDDVAAKAKRLIDAGDVTLLRNGYNNVVGHVIGDHGEYNTEIGRDDPNSRAITQWTCECPWDQYAFQRTRKWKYLEARPCAHVMATLWKSMMTPLDEELSEQQAEGMGTGQAIGPGMGAPSPSPVIPNAQIPANLPRSFSPEGDIIQGDQTQLPIPSQPPPAAGGAPPMAPPGAPDVLPPFAGDQMEMAMPPAPGQTPGGMPSPPGSVSVPGAKLPSPFNPIQFPGGTYSRVANEDLKFELNSVGGHGADDYESDEGDAYTLQAFRGDRPVGSIDYNLLPESIHVRWVEVPEGLRRQGIGSALLNEAQQRHGLPVETSGLTPEGEQFWEHRSNWWEDEDTRQYQQGLCGTYACALMRANPELRFGSAGDEDYPAQHFFAHDDTHAYDSIGKHPLPYLGANPKETGWTYNELDDRPEYYGLPDDEAGPEGGEANVQKALEHVRRVHGFGGRVAAAQFQNGQIVRLKNNAYGMAEGKSEEHGAGQYRTVPEGSSGEVLGQDPQTGYIDCIFPLDDSGPMEPFHVRCYLEPKDLVPSQMRPPGPMVRRRR